MAGSIRVMGTLEDMMPKESLRGQGGGVSGPLIALCYMTKYNSKPDITEPSLPPRSDLSSNLSSSSSYTLNERKRTLDSRSVLGCELEPRYWP